MNPNNSNILFIAAFLNVFIVSGQFTVTDSICVGQTVPITGYDTNDSYHYWIYEAGSVESSKPKAEVITSFSIPGGSEEGPVWMAVANDGANIYSFITKHQMNPNLYRQSWGNSLLNSPTDTFLLDLSPWLNPLAKKLEGIQIVRDSGKWYGFVLGGLGINSRLLRLDFGTDITSVPSVTNLGIQGNMGFPHDIHMVKDSGYWYAFVGDVGISGVSVFKFDSGLTKPPVVKEYIFDKFTSSNGIYPIKENGKWYVFCVSEYDSTLGRINFNSGDLMNATPSADNLGTLNNPLRGPRDISITNDCNHLSGIISNRFDSSVVFLDFPSGIAGMPVARKDSTLSLSYPHSISEFYREGKDLLIFTINIASGRLIRLRFSETINHTSPLNPLNNQINPADYSYNSPGTYAIMLTRNYDVNTTICKLVRVLEKPIPEIKKSSFYCTGKIITTNPVLNGVIYKWHFPDGTEHNEPTPVITEAGRKLYKITVNTGNCYSSDTELITVSDSIKPGLDSVVGVCNTDSFNLFKGLRNYSSSGSWRNLNLSVIKPVGSMVTLDNLKKGVYNFIYRVTDIGTCPDSTAVVTLNVTERIFAGYDTTLDFCSYGTLDLSKLIPDYHYGGYWIDIDNNGYLTDSILNAAAINTEGEYQYIYKVDSTVLCKASQAVITMITDRTPPIVICPDSVIRTLTPQHSEFETANNELDPIEVSDNCPGWQITNNISGQGTLNEYRLSNSEHITWTITDVHGNTAQCEFDFVLNKGKIPNMFTPNGDGINDVWEFNLDRDYPEAVVKVFNRWGLNVYTSDKGYHEKWDGRDKQGLDQPSDGYMYIIRDDRKVLFKGSVTIVR